MQIRNLNTERIRKVAELIEHRPDKYDPNSMVEFDILNELAKAVKQFYGGSQIMDHLFEYALSWNHVSLLRLYERRLSTFPESIIKLKFLSILDLRTNRLVASRRP